MLHLKLFAALFAAALLTGCAFTSEKIDIRYTQQQGVAQVPGAHDVLVAVEVNDSRSDKSKVSSKKNGYGMETAPITSNEEVAVTVGRALEQEIRARGFRAGSGAGDVKLVAELNRFYNDHKLGFFSGDAVADLSLAVRVSDPVGKSLYSRTITAQGKEENTQLATGNNAALALDKALANGMTDLFNDAAFIDALRGQASPLRSDAKSMSQQLEELAADKTISSEEYRRRYDLIRAAQK